jgi:D-alanyl-D-alanine-carboxypeptidase/D-alanyl-D-alanine-endopeptidase
MTPPRLILKDGVMLPEGIDGDHLSLVADQATPAVTELVFVRDRRAWLWPNDAGTRLFNIGSITKTFTSLLLAQMIETDDVQLDDTIGDHLPMASGSGDVQLLELAMHTSGLPQLPEPIASRAHRCPEDPYSTVTTGDMIEAARLAQPGPTRGTFEYSNFGYALLGLVLASAGGRSFEDLLTRRVLEPLELRDTVFDIHDDPRLVDGHDIDGTRVPHWHNPAMPGCGALLATVGDIGRYLTAHLDPGSTPLPSAIRLAQQLQRLRPSGHASALSWTIDDVEGVYRYSHNGATFGFFAYAAFAPARSTGIAIVQSRTPAGFGELERLGNQLLDHLTYGE